MKLIDADALIEQMEADAEQMEEPLAKMFAYAAINDVKHAPTVEAPDINVGNIDTTTHGPIPVKNGRNDEDRTSGDCISRQQAIDALKEKVFHNLSDEFYGAMQVLDELPSAQPEQRWIPCSERQPDKEGDYLVTLLDDGRTWVEVALWNETFGGRWQAVLYNDVDYSDISNVIAWMPLPEPYQGVER